MILRRIGKNIPKQRKPLVETTSREGKRPFVTRFDFAQRSHEAVKECKMHFLSTDGIRDVAAAPKPPNWGGGAGRLWGPKLV